MTAKLYFNGASAGARAVLLVAKAANVDLEIIEVENLGLEPFFYDLANGQQSVPTLEDGNIVLQETHSICQYLVEKYGSNDDLIPKDLEQRALMNQFLHFNSACLLPTLSMLMIPILQDLVCEIPAVKLKRVHEAYAMLNEKLKSGNYLTSTLSIADLCCVSSISTFTTILPIASETYDHLFRWYGRLKALPYYKDANETGLNKLDAILETKLRRI